MRTSGPWWYLCVCELWQTGKYCLRKGRLCNVTVTQHINKPRAVSNWGQEWIQCGCCFLFHIVIHITWDTMAVRVLTHVVNVYMADAKQNTFMFLHHINMTFFQIPQKQQLNTWHHESSSVSVTAVSSVSASRPVLLSPAHLPASFSHRYGFLLQPPPAAAKRLFKTTQQQSGAQQ